ncbi:hypothetical protein ACFVU4_32485 [Streptomyces sp. NPDC058107]|uniref:hypothetical protein n=1 Tax=Streptomyces sp. NPDC058107 TaxID=3346343 RepID=UPI0036E05FC9
MRRGPVGRPRAKLLSGERWQAAAPRVLTALGLEGEPAGYLAELASELHAAYVHVAAGLPGNAAVQIEGGKLKLAMPGKAAEPRLMPPFCQLVNNMLPRGDFPELLLEAAELTAFRTPSPTSPARPLAWRASRSACAWSGWRRPATSG